MSLNPHDSSRSRNALSATFGHSHSTRRGTERFQDDINSTSSASDPLSSPVHVSQQSSQQVSREPSPFVRLPDPKEFEPITPTTPNRNHGAPYASRSRAAEEEEGLEDDDDFEAWDDEDPLTANMPSDLRTSKSQQPLLPNDKSHQAYDSPQRPLNTRRSTSRFHERDPEIAAKAATKKRYMYAAVFLVISLISFTVQTETAVYIQHNLHWNKAYSMLYLTHGSWSLLWPTQLLILRLQNYKTPWAPFWRRHIGILRSTAQMVEHRTLHVPTSLTRKSPVPYFVRTTAFVTCALTVAGGSWYVAVDQTTASDLTAIYNCSAFFAYAFAIPLLNEKLRWNKVFAVAVAIAGVLVVAYGDTAPSKHGSKSGGGAGGPSAPQKEEANNRALGNVVIGIGSVLYGFYEVLYKKVACPPDGCSPGRGMLFANTFGSMIGLFTLTVLWFPIPILHYTGLETFELPRGEAAWMLLISVLANATFSGSFLVLISLTSPVLSSVAALLTIFLVAVVDQLLPPPLNSPLSAAAVAGGGLIVVAFLLLSWATFREMQEEKRQKAAMDGVEESDVEDL
ncbi:putative EamA-like transporter family protein [Elsinoe australis]|uniref:Putative EamA-like transporter family protein n=1 Tax=Elsinoe australis TaxID=40998 RepID=A0A4U7B3E4_9PEZI|nr:putative EamA-like transporter family protein [Elsinoe australis]